MKSRIKPLQATCRPHTDKRVIQFFLTATRICTNCGLGEPHLGTVLGSQAHSAPRLCAQWLSASSGQCSLPTRHSSQSPARLAQVHSKTSWFCKHDVLHTKQPQCGHIQPFLCFSKLEEPFHVIANEATMSFMFYKNDSRIINISTPVLILENVTVLCICIHLF